MTNRQYLSGLDESGGLGPGTDEQQWLCGAPRQFECHPHQHVRRQQCTHEHLPAQESRQERPVSGERETVEVLGGFRLVGVFQVAVTTHQQHEQVVVRVAGVDLESGCKRPRRIEGVHPSAVEGQPEPSDDHTAPVQSNGLEESSARGAGQSARPDTHTRDAQTDVRGEFRVFPCKRDDAASGLGQVVGGVTPHEDDHLPESVGKLPGQDVPAELTVGGQSGERHLQRMKPGGPGKFGRTACDKSFTFAGDVHLFCPINNLALSTNVPAKCVEIKPFIRRRPPWLQGLRGRQIPFFALTATGGYL